MDGIFRLHFLTTRFITSKAINTGVIDSRPKIKVIIIIIFLTIYITCLAFGWPVSENNAHILLYE